MNYYQYVDLEVLADRWEEQQRILAEMNEGDRSNV